MDLRKTGLEGVGLAGSCETVMYLWGSIRGWDFLDQLSVLLASEEGLCSTENSKSTVKLLNTQSNQHPLGWVSGSLGVRLHIVHTSFLPEAVTVHNASAPSWARFIQGGMFAGSVCLIELLLFTHVFCA
jgi:hypothetical protein